VCLLAAEASASRVAARGVCVSYVSIRQHTAAYVSIRQHTSAYDSTRQHTSAYVSIRQHSSAYVSIYNSRALRDIYADEQRARVAARGVCVSVALALVFAILY
jgi:hypothetical protein